VPLINVTLSDVVVPIAWVPKYIGFGLMVSVDAWSVVPIANSIVAPKIVLVIKTFFL
jgi:hypothetical protein